MILIGMSGRAGAGKDTVGDYLVRAHGFVKFSFSDALYREVRDTFALAAEDDLRDRGAKERVTFALAPNRCTDLVFTKILLDHLHSKHPSVPPLELQSYPLSPREVLQLYGTEYRRTQDSQYWIKRAEEWMLAKHKKGYERFVNTATRFPNEQEFIYAAAGTVWHVMRRDLPEMANADHVSEKPLPVRYGDQVLFNDGSIALLESRADAAMEVLLRKAA